MNLKAYLKQRQTLVNRALQGALPAPGSVPGRIHEAMRYSVLGKGKRIRPILALAACEAVGGKLSEALQAACALELVHAYSLVHDDLPAMDDDDLRRGKPSCHKKFGEALGILTGDALLTYAFELLTRANSARADGSVSSNGNGRGSAVRLNVIREVAKAIGTQGMIGGQVADVAIPRNRPDSRSMEFINTRKTGALISGAVRVGALLGRAKPQDYRMLQRYGDRIGLVFQLVDDLLDKDGAVRLSGRDPVRRRAERLTAQAIDALKPLGGQAEPLRELARFILTRSS